jgi:hypothetical protein
MTDAEKRARDLFDHFTAGWLPRIADLRDLSRPVRRKSHYPTFQALYNALIKFTSMAQETDAALLHLQAELEEIREHAKRERLSRG